MVEINGYDDIDIRPWTLCGTRYDGRTTQNDSKCSTIAIIIIVLIVLNTLD